MNQDINIEFEIPDKDTVIYNDYKFTRTSEGVGEMIPIKLELLSSIKFEIGPIIIPKWMWESNHAAMLDYFTFDIGANLKRIQEMIKPINDFEKSEN